MNPFENIVKTQNNYFDSNKTKNIQFRKAQLKKLKKLIEKNEDKLHEAIYSDLKKSKYENSVSELFPVYHEINIAIKHLSKWAKKKRVQTNLLNFPAKSYIIKEPLGTVLVIGAWNYPYVLSLTPLIAAISAGNTVILKPSEIAPHTSQVLTYLINTNFEKEFIHVIEGGINETTQLLKNKFDKIFFTGSPSVGKIIYQEAAKHLTPVTLELGGKNPAIFHKDASLNVCIKRMVWSKFLNAGQICMSPDYVLVHDSIKEIFLKKTVEEIKKHNYSIEKGNYVQIINSKNTERLIKLIDKNKIYYGGNYSKEKNYIEPTLLHNITSEDPIMKEEIFGPILPILSYSKIEEAISFIKQFEKPLSCYAFTNNSTIKKQILNNVSFGVGGINEALMNFTNSNLPFGGVGNSGIGNYHGKYGFNTFSHKKAVLDKSPLIELNLKYYNQTPFKLKIIKQLFKWG